MPTEKTYEIDSFEKLLNVVDDENYEILMADFLKWVAVYHAYVKELRKKHPKETKGKSNWQIAEASFHWIDDGKTDIKYIEHHNKHTGEVTKINMCK